MHILHANELQNQFPGRNLYGLNCKVRFQFARVSSSWFKDCTLVAIQVALQHIKLCTIFQHADQKSGIFHIDLENIFDRIAVERKLRKGQIIASGNNPCVFNPLQTPGVLRRCSSFSDNRILKLFIFFAELFGDRLEVMLCKYTLLPLLENGEKDVFLFDNSHWSYKGSQAVGIELSRRVKMLME